MGQNCVAGTTELDEGEGIGLVLYVNSESNLIVWKMNDGTKQGNVVPLTTDYQNMLKSEFENKTGVTIGYIIIHRYTEETIDIESSIKINSGETPTKNHFAISIDERNSRYAVGYIENSHAYIDSDVENSVMLIDSSGVYRNNLELKEVYRTQLIAKISNDIETVNDIVLVTVTDISIGDNYPGFNELPKYNW